MIKWALILLVCLLSVGGALYVFNSPKRTTNSDVIKNCEHNKSCSQHAPLVNNNANPFQSKEQDIVAPSETQGFSSPPDKIDIVEHIGGELDVSDDGFAASVTETSNIELGEDYSQEDLDNWVPEDNHAGRYIGEPLDVDEYLEHLREKGTGQTEHIGPEMSLEQYFQEKAGYSEARNIGEPIDPVSLDDELSDNK